MLCDMISLLHSNVKVTLLILQTQKQISTEPTYLARLSVSCLAIVLYCNPVIQTIKAGCSFAAVFFFFFFSLKWEAGSPAVLANRLTAAVPPRQSSTFLCRSEGRVAGKKEPTLPIAHFHLLTKREGTYPANIGSQVQTPGAETIALKQLSC